MSKEQTAKKERFLREVERQLLRKGLDSEMTEGGIYRTNGDQHHKNRSKGGCGMMEVKIWIRAF